jgi:hypothetical protein
MVRYDDVRGQAMARAVAYLRVSTAQQGKSGLRLEAQRQAAEAFAAHGHVLTAELVEVETGKSTDVLDRRPQLAAVLTAARKLGKGTPGSPYMLQCNNTVHREFPARSLRIWFPTPAQCCSAT